MSTNHASIINNNDQQQTVEDDNPNLFWLPARLHPEIAPQEFKAFIEEATKPENLLRRTSSAFGNRKTLSDPNDRIANSSLARKKSMLSHVYDPSTDDSNSSSDDQSSPSKKSTEGLSDSPKITRGTSMSYGSGGGRGLGGLDSLTINDLQRLESLVLKRPSPSLSYSTLMESSEGNIEDADSAGNRIKAIIRRSMSLANPSMPISSDLDIPQELGLEAIDDSPLIARGPAHIIRRTARTKVRKTSLAGDGGGHRFPATRRTKLRPTQSPDLSNSPTGSREDAQSPPRSQPPTPDLRAESIDRNLSSTGTGDDDPLRTSLALESKLARAEQALKTSLSSSCSSSTTSSSASSSSSSKAPSTTTLNPSISLTRSTTEPPLTAKPNITPEKLTPSSEDDSTLNSRDSVASNSSLLDAYIDQSVSSEDSHVLSSQPGSLENALPNSLSSSSFQSTTADSVTEISKPIVPQPLGIYGIPQTSSAHSSSQSLISAASMSPPQSQQGLPLARSQSQSPSSDPNLKPGSAKPMMNIVAKSAEDLPSSSTSPVGGHATALNLTNIIDFPFRPTPSVTAAPVTPNSKALARPTVSQTKTSPPVPQSVSVGGPPEVPAKANKEKKRGAWVKLSLSSSSTGDKSKKGKGKDKSSKVAAGSKDKQESSTSQPGGLNKQTVAGTGTTGVANHQATTSTPPKKESGFLSGLFGSKSKKQDQDQHDKSNQGKSAGQTGGSQNSNHSKSPISGGAAIANQIMYGSHNQQQQMMMINPTASGGFIKGKYTSFYRLPIHVERAVYRLSHIKLANPRRPLYEQVLISNLMFWYLGVINKNQTTPAEVPGSNSSANSNSPENQAQTSSLTSSSNTNGSKSSKSRGQSSEYERNSYENLNSTDQSSTKSREVKSKSGNKNNKKSKNRGGYDQKSSKNSNSKNKFDSFNNHSRKDYMNNGNDDRESSLEDSSMDDYRDNCYSSNSGGSSNTDEDGSITTEENEQNDQNGEDDDLTKVIEGFKGVVDDEEEDEDEDEDDDEKPLGARVKLKKLGGGEGNWINGNHNNHPHYQNSFNQNNGSGGNSRIQGTREPGHGHHYSQQQQYRY